MKSKVGIVALVMCVSVLCVGAVASAVDYTWDCTGGCSGSWISGDSWSATDDGFPDDANDNASMTSTRNLITYDPDSAALTINDLVLSGASPTKRKLHITNFALIVDGVATLGDYAEFDVDEDLTIADTDMSGDIWVNVENGNTMDLGTTVDVVGSAAGGISCTLHLQDNDSGTFQGDTVTIDADTPDATRGFKLSSSGSTFDVLTKLVLKSDQTTGTNRAKLWISAGTINIAAAGSNGILDVDGGNGSARRVDIDIDDILTAEETQFAGYAAIDVAPDKTATGGDVIFERGAIVKKTGSGTFRSGA